MVYSFDLNMTPGASGIPQIVKLSQYDKTIPDIPFRAEQAYILKEQNRTRQDLNINYPEVVRP